jgi:hypothetical protein
LLVTHQFIYFAFGVQFREFLPADVLDAAARVKELNANKNEGYHNVNPIKAVQRLGFFGRRVLTPCGGVGFSFGGHWGL